MTEQQLPLIAPETAEKARAELLSALNAADNPTAWMGFMESVTRLLPDILSPGRPSTAAIKSSPIGQLGFKSWQAMVEAPADAHGLAWNFHSWRAWRRAWATVQANPWLRDQPFSSSEINNLAIEFKPFPESLEALQALRQAKASDTEQKRTITLTEALKAAQEAQAAASTLREQLAESASRERSLAEEVGSLRGKLELALVELRELKLRQPVNVVQEEQGSSTLPPNTGLRRWWSRLMAFLGFGA